MCKLKVNNYYHGLFFHKSEDLKCFSTIMANKTTSFFMISSWKSLLFPHFLWQLKLAQVKVFFWNSTERILKSTNLHFPGNIALLVFWSVLITCWWKKNKVMSWDGNWWKELGLQFCSFKCIHKQTANLVLQTENNRLDMDRNF